MKTIFWIAKSLSGKKSKHQYSTPIVNFAIGGIGLGIALIILSISIVKGFQGEIRDKVVGFGSHLTIVSNEQQHSRETFGFQLDPDLMIWLDSVPQIRTAQTFALKPGILETKANLQGVVIKGLGLDYDWNFFEDKLIEGQGLQLNDTLKSEQIIISKKIADKLELGLEDKVTLYFVRQEGEIRPRNFRIQGIYNTGLSEFDEQFVFVDLQHLQKINMWGIEAQMKLNQTDEGISVEGLGFGGKSRLNYLWNNGWQGKGPHNLDLQSDSLLRVVVSDQTATVPDTAWIQLTLTDSVSEGLSYELSRWTSGGSHKYYVGGIELLTTDFDALVQTEEELRNSGEIPYYLRMSSIQRENDEIFTWLGMLDLNVILIIGLMIIISIVNMTSALLIIILERTHFIAMLKVLGMKTTSVVWVFMIHSTKIIIKGFLLGNLIGFGIAFIQMQWGIVKLDPGSYYLSEVPIHFHWLIPVVQVVCLVVCFIFMIIPAMYVALIQPAKALRFD